MGTVKVKPAKKAARTEGRVRAALAANTKKPKGRAGRPPSPHTVENGTPEMIVGGPVAAKDQKFATASLKGKHRETVAAIAALKPGFGLTIKSNKDAERGDPVARNKLRMRAAALARRAAAHAKADGKTRAYATRTLDDGSIFVECVKAAE